MTNGNETTDYVRFTENSVKPQERYEFVENEDYISFHKKMERGVGGTVRIEYFVCVSQKNETQRAVRLCGKSRLCSLPQKNGSQRAVRIC